MIINERFCRAHQYTPNRKRICGVDLVAPYREKQNERSCTVMDCPDYTMRPISTSNGQYAIKKIAYALRCNIRNEQTGEMVRHHSRVSDLIDSKIYLPQGADENLNNISVFANTIDRIGDVAQGYNILLVLPRGNGITHAHHKEMVDMFFQQNFLSKNVPVIVGYHSNEKKLDDAHVHAIAWDRQLVNGEICEQKSYTPYVDNDGNIIEKIDSPDLTRKGFLKFNSDGSIKMKKGYQKLVVDTAGQPVLDSEGKPKVIDIRIPEIDETTQKQKEEKNGKYFKLVWKREKHSLHGLDALGITRKHRIAWQECQNAILKKHNIRNRDGSLMQVDLRSLEEQEADLPSWLHSTAELKIGWGRRAAQRQEINEKEIRPFNKIIRELQPLYRSATVEQKKQMDAMIKKDTNLSDLKKIVISVCQSQAKENSKPVQEDLHYTNLIAMTTQSKKTAIIKIVNVVFKKSYQYESDKLTPKEFGQKIYNDLSTNERSFISALRFIEGTEEYKRYQNAVREKTVYERTHGIKPKKQPSIRNDRIRSDTERTQ